MRILHVIPSLAAVHGGPSVAIRLMERAAIAEGFHVETASTDDEGPGQGNGKPCDVPLSEEAVTRWYFRKRLDFYKVAPRFVLWMHRNVKRFDVVHIHALFSFTSIVAAAIARRASVPYVIRPLGVLNDYGIRHRRSWLKSLSLKLVEAPLLRRAAAVHFTAIAERDEAAQLGLTLHPVVIPLGIEVPAPNLQGRLAERDKSSKNVRLLYLSRLDPKKNLEGLIRAVAILDKSDAHFHLTVAGTGDPTYCADLRVLAQDMRVEHRITWTGHVSGDAKATVFQNAEIFVLPSFSENFGIAVVEAMMYGLPVILTPGVAVSETVSSAGAGLAVNPDPQAIADGIQFYLDNPNIREECGHRAIDLATSHYSMEGMGRQLSALYHEIQIAGAPRA